MKTVILFLNLIFLSANLMAQTQITGQVKDEKGKAVAFANVYLQDIFDGATTDEDGHFNFQTEQTGEVILVVSFTGYEKYQSILQLNGEPISVNPILKFGAQELLGVVITAGSFEASDENRMTILKPLDIVRVASAEGDIYGALRALPGVSPQGDETGIFVRGGEASETKTIINGSIVPRPFFSEVPNVPSRGRFDPFNFKGTMFSTGGYSAEYGQALSSVLLLNTQDVPDESSSGFSLNAAGIDLSRTQLLGENTAIIGSFGYTNLDPLFSVIPQNVDWEIAPRGYGGTLAFRHQIPQTGTFKTFVQYQNGNIAIRFPNLDEPGETTRFQNNNDNIYVNSSYQGLINQKWLLYGGFAYNRINEFMDIGSLSFSEEESFYQGRLSLGKDIGEIVYLKFGGEIQKIQGEYGFEQFSQRVNDTYGASFAEAELSISEKLAGRVGLRAEYSAIVDDYSLAPRVSFAYKTGKDSQISLAYGHFFQRPESEFLRISPEVNFEKSIHYIFNYQWTTKVYTFRAELYYKDYQNLIKIFPSRSADVNPLELPPNEVTLDNSGYGYATGIDLFWRDKKSIKNLDYWVSYSYINSERNYQEFPSSARPDFVTNHVLNVVGIYNIKAWATRLGATYTYASGRTFFNPNNPEFLGDETPDFHNLSLNGSYITNVLGNFTVFYVSVTNPLGIRQVFRYQYSRDGSRRQAIGPSATTRAFIGMFMSF